MPDEPRPAIFFDDGRASLAPLRDLRPIFDCRTGALTTLDRLGRALRLQPVALFVRPELAALAGERHGLPINRVPDFEDTVTLINGRCPLPLDVLEALEPGQAVIERETGDLVGARAGAGVAREILAGGAARLDTIQVSDRVLMSRPWDARRFRDASIEIDLRLLLGGPRGPEPEGCCILGEAPLRIAPGARVFPACVLDTEKGPIVIDEAATIRPRATIIGPAYIGPASTVLDGALIKPGTAIGPSCKVAGEVGGTVIQGFSNKAHDGHLGDSWLGEWVNLGAGTTNSNLLNTYSEVTAVAEPGAPRERTGEVFLGCVLGDHVRTAIGTRIMTGAVAHTGAMWAASWALSGCVPRFAWATDEGVKSYRPAKFAEVARAAMGRRGISPSEAYLARVAELAAQG